MYPLTFSPPPPEADSLGRLDRSHVSGWPAALPWFTESGSSTGGVSQKRELNPPKKNPRKTTKQNKTRCFPCGFLLTQKRGTLKNKTRACVALSEVVARIGWNKMNPSAFRNMVEDTERPDHLFWGSGGQGEKWDVWAASNSAHTQSFELCLFSRETNNKCRPFCGNPFFKTHPDSVSFPGRVVVCEIFRNLAQFFGGSLWGSACDILESCPEATTKTGWF